MEIHPAICTDASAIADIYNHYVLHTTATFEEEAVSADVIASRIASVEAAGLPWLVAESDRELAGYAYAIPWKARSAYRFSVEITVYLKDGRQGHGTGSQLYACLFDELKQTPINAVMAGIALPNNASIRLHEKFGMEKVAHFRCVGRKFGQWVDVGYWEKELIGTETAPER